MNKPKKHIREEERLIELESFSIMDSLTEDEYDNITAIAAGICGTPISLISLVDDKRQWFKSHHGLDVTETSKDYAFCAHAIHDPNELFMVKDARVDDRFADNPLVTDDPNVIFYAGVPLMSENDLPLGTLCVIDNKPKELSENQVKLLKALAKQVMIILNLRKTKLSIATNELAESKQRVDNKQQLTEAQKIAKLGSWLFEPSTQHSTWSEEMFSIWGFDPKKGTPVFTDIFQRIHSDDIELFNHALEKAVSVGTPFDFSYRIHHPGGEIKTVRSISKSVFNDVGEVVSLKGTSQDITVSESVAKELIRVETEVKALQSTVDAAWLSIEFSPEGTILKANDNFVAALGYASNAKLEGKHHKVFCEPVYIKSEDYKNFWKNLADGKQQAGEFKRIRKDGSEIWINANYTPVIDATGKVVKIIKIANDISEMVAARAQSESVAKELRQFIETANAPIFGIDSKGMVNEWNQTAEKITGFRKGEVLGQDLVKTYITADYQEQVKQVLDNALKGEETANYEFPLFTKDDKRVMVLLNSSTRRDAEGNIVGVLGVGQDITALSDYKENLEAKIIENVKERTQVLEVSLEREKELGLLKSSFISVASHQFRTPLAVIQSNAELLEMLNNSDDKQEPEKYVKITSRIVEGISKMTAVMDDVLALGELTSGNVSYAPEALDLVVFCEKLVKEINFIQRDGRTLNFVVHGETNTVQLDANLLSHSLLNLISIAFNNSAGKGDPQLSIHFEPKEVVLTLKDFDLGILDEEQLHLFEPFFRANNVTEIQGTGLGLSIAKEYVEINKGTISAKSIEGEGSCFEIRFKVD
jgi:PAS domain S-box-containing protein